MLLASAIAFCWTELSKPLIKTINDLYFINGHFRDYRFEKNGGRYTIYTFRLKEFSNSFKIKADFLSGFRIDEFKHLNYGNDLTLSIAKDDINNLNTNNSYFFVFSIVHNKTTFLDPAFTIRKHNSHFMYYGSAAFFILGLILIYYGRQWKRKMNNSQLPAAG